MAEMANGMIDELRKRVNQKKDGGGGSTLMDGQAKWNKPREKLPLNNYEGTKKKGFEMMYIDRGEGGGV